MYNVATITTALRGLVGFRQHFDESLTAIETDLVSSRSGLWLDKAHALITAPILSGAAVQLTPSETTDPLSTLIRNTLDDSVAAVLSALRTRKLLRLESQMLLGLTALYEGEGSISDLIQPAGRFVALELTSNDTEMSIANRRIGIQLTGPAPDLPIYKVSGNGERVLAQTISTTFSGRMQWFDTDIILSGADSYKIGYDESDLPAGVQAVRRNKSIGNLSCGGCDPTNSTLWGRWKPFLSVRAVRQDNPGDPYDVAADQNFGINLAIAIGCDIGPTLLNQEFNMAEAIQQQAVVKLLGELAFSPRITTIEQMVRQNALFALKNGEEAKLERLLTALDIDFSGLSTRCLPATDTGGMIRRKTVFNP